jgi:transcriptional regulator with XRE-family HTH domain
MYLRHMDDNPDGWDRWAQRKVQRVAFGKQLRALRTAAGLSQDQLGARIGCTDGRAIQRWEGGQKAAESTPVELGDVAAIANALGCGVGPLIASLLPGGQQVVDDRALRRLAGEAVEQLVASLRQELTEGEFLAWIKEWRQLPPAHRAVLAELASAYNRDRAADRARLQAAAERAAAKSRKGGKP